MVRNKNTASQFWRELARELKDHPAIVDYNILNEPHLLMLRMEVKKSGGIV